MADSTVLGRELGWRLRAAMHAADLTGQQMAERLGVSPSRTSRMLTGNRGSSLADVATFLAMCGVVGVERERILALCSQDREPGLLRLRGAERWISLREHTGQAQQITEFAPLMLPWGMQTPEYTCAIANATDTAEDVTAAWDGYRVRLVHLTDQSPTGMWEVVLHESVLRTPVGSRKVMSEQLHRLLQWAVHPGVILRVVPASAGAHAGMAGGFTVLEFADLPTLVYREDDDGGVFLDTARIVKRTHLTIRRLRQMALDTMATRAMIRELAVELYGDPESDSFKRMMNDDDDSLVAFGLPT